MANGKISAIRVQNTLTGEWFSWDNGVWDKTPIAVNPSAGLYIAVYVQNRGTSGNITLIIAVSGDSYYVRKTNNVATNGSFGAEGTWAMPSGQVTASITVNDT